MSTIVSHWHVILSLISFAVWLGVTGYIVRTHTERIQRIESEMKKRLYRSDGSQIYMTTEGCNRHHAHCEKLRAEERGRTDQAIKEIHSKLDSLIREVQGMGRTMAVFNDFMERERRNVAGD